MITQKGTEICHQIFLDARAEIKQRDEELITTLGDDAYHLSQIKTWLQRFNKVDLSWKGSSCSTKICHQIFLALRANFNFRVPAWGIPISISVRLWLSNCAVRLYDCVHDAKFSPGWMPQLSREAQKRRVLKHHDRCCEPPRLGRRQFWRNCNWRWVLLSIFLSLLESFCTIACSSRSRISISNRDEQNYCYDIFHRGRTSRSCCSASTWLLWIRLTVCSRNMGSFIVRMTFTKRDRSVKGTLCCTIEEGRDAPSSRLPRLDRCR
jgi:hypothetical protein